LFFTATHNIFSKLRTFIAWLYASWTRNWIWSWTWILTWQLNSIRFCGIDCTVCWWQLSFKIITNINCIIFSEIRYLVSILIIDHDLIQMQHVCGWFLLLLNLTNKRCMFTQNLIMEWESYLLILKLAFVKLRQCCLLEQTVNNLLISLFFEFLAWDSYFHSLLCDRIILRAEC